MWVGKVEGRGGGGVVKRGGRGAQKSDRDFEVEMNKISIRMELTWSLARCEPPSPRPHPHPQCLVPPLRRGPRRRLQQRTRPPSLPSSLPVASPSLASSSRSLTPERRLRLGTHSRWVSVAGRTSQPTLLNRMRRAGGAGGRTRSSGRRSARGSDSG